MCFGGALEEEFRQHYSLTSTRRARLLPSFSLMMTLIAIAMRLMNPDPVIVAVLFDVLVMLPLLVYTLYLSTRPEQYRLYQTMLATSGLLSGFVIVSIALRPTLADMPSYFSMETTWIFATWLILGLRFRVAAFVALTVSAMHVLSMFYMNSSIETLGYESVMLLLVNGIGAIGCYHLEVALRQAFLESREVSELAAELGRLVQLDGLTGLRNRRSYDEYIARVWKQSRREQVPLAIMLIDIDHFKNYNDHYGHQQGDDTLIEVARVIGACERRPLDFAARYGGEEFVLVLYDQSVESARKIADRLCARVRDLDIPHQNSSTGERLTISIGAAVIMPDAERSDAGALQMADEALYEAKESGRNCVVIKESGVTSIYTGQFRAERST